MRPSLRDAGVFLLCAIASAVLWLEIEPALAWGRGRSTFLHLFHVVRLASVCGLAVSLAAGICALVDAWVDSSLKDRSSRVRRGLVPAAVGATLAHPALEAGRLLASGDGVPRGFADAVTVVAMVMLAGVPATLVDWWRTGARTRRWAAAGGAALVLFTTTAPDMLATYAFLTPFVLGASTFVGAALGMAAVERWQPLRTRIVRGVLGALVVAWLVPAVWPKLDARARRSFLRTEASSTAIDVVAFGALSGRKSAVFPDVAMPGRRACAAPRAKWPKLRWSAEHRRNVIVVSIDALRRDTVDWNLEGRAVAPRVAGFMRTAFTPARTYTSYPATLFALSGAVTGLSPSRLLASARPRPGLFRLLEHAVDERHMFLPATDWFQAPALDLAVTQGVAPVYSIDAVAATDAVIATLTRARENGRSVFLWVHYDEPHKPYDEHPEFPFGTDLREVYAGEVAFADREAGRLLDYLANAGWRDDSLVAVLSDHGESLGERGRIGHHVSLDRWVMDVPFALGLPPGPAPSPPAVASLLDVAPTVLHYLNVAPPRTRLDGRSLFAPDAEGALRRVVAEAFPLRGNDLMTLIHEPLATPADLAARLARVSAPAAQYAPKVALVMGNRRLIVHRASGLVQSYDITNDPDEKKDLSRREKPTTRWLLRELRRWHRDTATAMRCDALEKR